MWYHLYLLYFLVAVVLTLVILIIVMAEDTIIQTLLAGGASNTFTLNNFTGDIVLSDLELQGGDTLIFGTSGNNNAAYTVVFQLKKDSVVIAKTTITAASPEATLNVPTAANDYSLDFDLTNGNQNDVVIEFIQLRRTKRILF